MSLKDLINLGSYSMRLCVEDSTVFVLNCFFVVVHGGSVADIISNSPISASFAVVVMRRYDNIECMCTAC